MNKKGKIRVYMASKVKHAPRWRAMREAGFPIISTWIDEAGPGETLDRPDLGRRGIDEPSSADFLIAYAEEGERQQGALVEIGAALSAGVRVLAIGPVIKESSAFAHHPLWRWCGSLNEAIDIIAEYHGNGEERRG